MAADKMDIDTPTPTTTAAPADTTPPPPSPERSVHPQFARVYDLFLTTYSIVIINNFALINQAVDDFDPRFTLRALRSIATLRKAPNFADALHIGIRHAFPKPQNHARKALEEVLPAMGKSAEQQSNGSVNGDGKDTSGGPVKELDALDVKESESAEVWAYLGVLVQVCLSSNPPSIDSTY